MNNESDKININNYSLTVNRKEVNEYLEIIGECDLISNHIEDINVITSFDIISYHISLNINYVNIDYIKGYLSSCIKEKPINAFYDASKKKDNGLVVTVEIPKEERNPLFLENVLDNLKYKESVHMSMGVDSNLETMFHPLSLNSAGIISGMCNSGKTTLLNVILISIMKFYLPKEISINLFTGREVRESDQLFYKYAKKLNEKDNNLNKIIDEMNRRYELFSNSFCMNIEEYNRYMLENGGEKLPIVFTIIDDYYNSHDRELMLLMFKGRAVGIYTLISIAGDNTSFYKTLYNYSTYQITFNKDLLRYDDFVYESPFERRRIKLPQISKKELVEACSKMNKYLR